MRRREEERRNKKAKGEREKERPRGEGERPRRDRENETTRREREREREGRTASISSANGTFRLLVGPHPTELFRFFYFSLLLFLSLFTSQSRLHRLSQRCAILLFLSLRGHGAAYWRRCWWHKHGLCIDAGARFVGLLQTPDYARPD